MKKIAIAALLAFSALSANAATELVVNGGFETGNLSGWTLSGNTGFSSVGRDTTTGNHSFSWIDGAVGSLGFLSQNIATTAGQSYNFSFDVYNVTTSNQKFEANFGANKVVSFSNEVHNWTHYTFNNLIASGPTTAIKFGIQNDPAYSRLDNVSVSAVPEPETYAMMLAGLGLLGLMAKRRKA